MSIWLEQEGWERVRKKDDCGVQKVKESKNQELNCFSHYTCVFALCRDDGQKKVSLHHSNTSYASKVLISKLYHSIPNT
ncbi:uncharacterized protein MEPE_03182 [Melanopsichium pennsylvanicum]|uniref:Uncharacterized protein n=1 Tax=Melanopsichium pennsylvanicum TaxID=63383 RepID=A0AAJ4XNW1_9BASI|nr:uncharacterized protein MEPE_03182 [Melanopsichium pennsylvanicum]